MVFNRVNPEIGEGKSGVIGLEDAPGLTALEMQEKLDELAIKYIIPAQNDMADKLNLLQLEKRVYSPNITSIRAEENEFQIKTADNDWVTCSGGHKIADSSGNSYAQREILQFVNAQVVDEPLSGATKIVLQAGEKGEKGDNGADGRSFSILGIYPTLEALKAAHPVAEAGQAYAVGTSANNTVYIYSTQNAQWQDLGPLQGAEGQKGDKGEKGEKGERGVPTTVNGKSGENVQLTTADVGAAKPQKIGVVKLSKDNWVEFSGEYRQNIPVAGLSAKTMISFLPNTAVVNILHQSGTLALFAENDGSIATAVATAQKPLENFQVTVLCTEVESL